MSDHEWFYISQRKKRNEKAKSIRDVRAPSISSDDNPFTGSAIVPTVLVNDEEDDFGEEEK
mgnify:CR=1 FL=1|jgi:hypothetical protein|tara:strand:+ start:662 stop:844 length:183 start_codon:yes stop_codon:yes gene_type:complete